MVREIDGVLAAGGVERVGARGKLKLANAGMSRVYQGRATVVNCSLLQGF